ncbi:polysaccharide deacetylase family protein [Nocardioides sp.]|uniref:polysaccharide deacetylase family protein n=1 Tax=Nocardioides sp. TaxID=35761 RepID=UPI00378318EC
MRGVGLARWVAAAVVAGSLVAPVGPALGDPGGATGRTGGVSPCSRGLVALTFDDGPSSAVTPALVRLLERKHVPATFFLVGSRIASAPDPARAEARGGFVIGNHTWLHTDLTTQTDAQIRGALASTRRLMVREHLHPTWLMRPPYGAIDDRVRAVVRSMGYTPVLWTIDSRDWTGLSSQQIRDGVVGAVRPHATNIVLQHDGVTNSPATLRAVPGEIADLRARGYCFAALDGRGRPTPPVPLARVSADQPSVPEGGRVRLTVRLDQPTSRPTSARLELDAPPRPGGAVTLSARTVRFGVGQQEAHVWLRSSQDPVDEHGGAVTVRVGAGRGLRASVAGVRVSLGDDDPSPVADLADTTVRAAADSVTDVGVPVRLDHPSDRPVRVVVRSELGRAVGVVPPSSRTGWVVLAVPPEEPGTPTRVLDVRLVRAVNARAGQDAHLTVEPPAEPPAEPPPGVSRPAGG